MSEDSTRPPLTCCVVDSRARTSAPQANVAGFRASDLGYGESTSGSSARSRRASSSSKTLRVALEGGCPLCGEICTCWGTVPVPTRFLPPTSERLTSEGVSSLLPTPTASTYGSNQGGAAGRKGAVRLSLEAMARRGLLPTPRAQRTTYDTRHGKIYAAIGSLAGSEGRLSPRFVEWMMGFPDDWTQLDESPSATPLSPSAPK